MDERVHGVLSTYVNHHCRCDACRAANAKYARDFKLRNKGQTPRHGTVSSYTNYGCRCDDCRKAKAASRSSNCAEEAKLQPCPFCGSKAMMENTLTEVCVRCTGCPARMTLKHRAFTDATAIRTSILNWNSRALPSTVNGKP